MGKTSRYIRIFDDIPEVNVSQAAACDGTKITTTSAGQETAPGTLPIF